MDITMRSADGSGAGHVAWDDVPGEERAVLQLVEVSTDDLIEEVWGLWPLCPTYDVLLGAELAERVATWSCSHDGRALAPVGALTRTPHGGAEA